METEGAKIEKLTVYKKAKDLRKHTFVITTNNKVFPKRYYTVINRVQNYALVIPDLIYDANRNKYKRQQLGNEAIGYVDKMLSCIDLLYEINSNLGGQRTDYWKKLACDVKYLTLAWIYPKRQ